MKKVFFGIFTIIFLLLLNPTTRACTNYLVTKGASADGSVMISYSADSHTLYGELYHWSAMSWAAGTMLDVYEWDTGKYLGQIPQIAQTYSVVGNMNEFQVAIGETTYGGREELGTQKGSIMDYGSLIYIALQRSKTAKEAILVIDDLMQKYGYASSGESFSIADKNEVWIMEIIGKGEGQKGAVWVARKIPEGYVSGHANQARITTFPLNDPANCLYSKDVISFAKENKLYVGDDKDFSFSDTYAPVDFHGARFCEIRVWSMFKDVNKEMNQYFDYAKGIIKHDEKFSDGRLNPNKYATNRMPLWVKADHKITQLEMFEFMRDHLEGTELDMTKDIGAGPFGVPVRWRPLTWKVDGKEYCNERATATQQTGFSFISQSRSWLPDQYGGILWFGVDDASCSVFTPIYSSTTKIPETFAKGNGAMMKFSENSAFWIFNQVTNFAYTRYNVIHPEIDSLQKIIELKNINLVKAIDKGAEELVKTDKKAAIDFVSDFSLNTANSLVYQWKGFYQYLFMKYLDGNIKTVNPSQMNPNVKQPGYGDDWYKRIVKETGTKLLVPETTGGH